MAVEVRAHRSGAAPEQQDGRWRLNAEMDWLVAGPTAELRDIASALPARMTTFFGEACLRLRFGNCVGHFDIPHLGRVEAVTGKWTEAHFEQMLAELTNIAASLPFAGYESSAVPYDRSIAARDDVLYHAFVYLRHVLSPAAPRHVRLLPALEAIVRQPHRLFVREHRRVDVWRARRIGVGALRAVSEGRESLVKVRSSGAIQGMRGMMPATVVEHFSRNEIDTPENRFVKAFLDQAVGILDRVERVFAEDVKLGPGVRADCHSMRAALTPCAGASIWDEVGPMVHVPAGSTVLQQRRGYREVFHHSHKLRLGSRVPLDAEKVRDLLEVKDIAELYELWCYFRVVDALREIHGRPVRVEGVAVGDKQASVEWGHRVRWGSGVEAFYNLAFSRSRNGRRHSYSLPLRPDIAVWSPGPAGGGTWTVLDAKFKLTRIPVSDDEAEASSKFKRGDIDKMHTYRDALPAVRDVWVMYPGDREVFFEAPGGGGVGAVPASPGSDSRRLQAVLGGED